MFCCISAKHVFIFALDGVGTALKQADTPTINAVMNKGVYTFKGRATFPTYSGPSWGTITHRVSPKLHGFLSNGIARSEKWAPDSSFPSVFRMMREQKPDSKVGVFAFWPIIPNNLIEEGFEIDKFIGSDEEVVEASIDYIKKQKPDLFFSCLNDPDAAGHKYGFFSDKHLEAISIADRRVKRMIEAVMEAGLFDDSMIIIVTDHGGAGVDKLEHGSNQEKDLRVFWTAMGGGLEHKELHRFYVGETAEYVAEALNLTRPESWDWFDPMSEDYAMILSADELTKWRVIFVCLLVLTCLSLIALTIVSLLYSSSRKKIGLEDPMNQNINDLV